MVKLNRSVSFCDFNGLAGACVAAVSGATWPRPGALVAIAGRYASELALLVSNSGTARRLRIRFAPSLTEKGLHMG